MKGYLRYWLLLGVTGLAACQSVDRKDRQAGGSASGYGQTATVFFDDMLYADTAAFHRNHWLIRGQSGHPGIKGARWGEAGIRFLTADETGQSPGILQLTAQTNGEGAGTQQVQVCHQRKYKFGTYAARVWFSEAPDFGPDGDEVVQTFYAISPLEAPMHPDYSEADFEYLPNGGWGHPSAPALWAASWETFRPDPWLQVNESSRKAGVRSGWHDLLLTISTEGLRYYVDGELYASHSAAVVPEVWMSVNFSLWFIAPGADGNSGPLASREPRQYRQLVDWVLQVPDQQLTQAEVQQQVQQFRQQGRRFIDNVPVQLPPAVTDCTL